MYYSTLNNAQTVALEVGDELSVPDNTWTSLKGKNPETGKWEVLPANTRLVVTKVKDSGLNRYQTGTAQDEKGTGAIYADKGDIYIDAVTDDGFHVGNVLAITFFQNF